MPPSSGRRQAARLAKQPDSPSSQTRQAGDGSREALAKQIATRRPKPTLSHQAGGLCATLLLNFQHGLNLSQAILKVSGSKRVLGFGSLQASG